MHVSQLPRRVHAREQHDEPVHEVEVLVPVHEPGGGSWAISCLEAPEARC